MLASHADVLRVNDEPKKRLRERLVIWVREKLEVTGFKFFSRLSHARYDETACYPTQTCVSWQQWKSKARETLKGRSYIYISGLEELYAKRSRYYQIKWVLGMHQFWILINGRWRIKGCLFGLCFEPCIWITWQLNTFFLFLSATDLTNFSSGPISQMTPFEERGTSAYTNSSKIKTIPWKRSLLSSLGFILNINIAGLKS